MSAHSPSADSTTDPILARKREEAARDAERVRPESREELIEEEEAAQLHGAFKAPYVTWFVVILVIAFAALIIGSFFYR